MGGTLDLHVLGAPLAFILSQDQTLQKKFEPRTETCTEACAWCMSGSGLILQSIKALRIVHTSFGYHCQLHVTWETMCLSLLHSKCNFECRSKFRNIFQTRCLVGS